MEMILGDLTMTVNVGVFCVSVYWSVSCIVRVFIVVARFTTISHISLGIYLNSNRNMIAILIATYIKFLLTFAYLYKPLKKVHKGKGFIKVKDSPAP